MTVQAHLPVHITLIKSIMSFMVLYVHRIHKVYWSRGKNGIRSPGPPPCSHSSRALMSFMSGLLTMHNYTSLVGTFLQTLPLRIGYAIAGALFISAQLSTDAVSALRKVWLLIRLWKQHGVEVCEPVWPSGKALSPFLTGRMFVRPNILRTLRRTMIRFLIEHLLRRIWFGQSKLYFILNWLVMRCKLRPELAANAQQTI